VARSRPHPAVRIVAGLLVALLVAGLLVSAFSGAANDTTTDPTSEVSSAAGAVGVSGLPVVTVAELPPEALDTLIRIQAGGPFRYEQDGGTFQNREGLLPDQPLGYYTEYTVETPGSDDRGARRFVVGGELEVLYWTDDHYDSFREVVPG
jgi:ribonuclease T1